MRQSRRRQAGDTDVTAPRTQAQATPQATQSTAPMRSSSVGPGRPKEERCSKAVCLAVKAELRRVKAQLKDAQTALTRERSQRATLMAGEIRSFKVERDEALHELDVLRNEHQMALKVRRFAQRLVVQLTDDKHELIDQKAKLAEDLWSTKSELAGQAKEAVSRARSASRDNRERDMQMRRIKEDGRLQGLGEAAAKLEAASAQVKDARDRAQRAEAAAQVTAEKEFARCQASIEAVVEAAKEQLAEAEAATACALHEAHKAREEADAEALAAEAARAAKDDAERAGLASERRAKRDRTKMLKAFGHEVVPTNVRSVDEWATLGYEARRKAGQRHRAWLKRYLETNSFRSCDIADVLDSLGLVEPLAKTKPFFNIHFFEVRALMKSLEEEHFGLAFGLFMHYDMRLTMPKLLQVSRWRRRSTTTTPTGTCRSPYCTTPSSRMKSSWCRDSSRPSASSYRRFASWRQ